MPTLIRPIESRDDSATLAVIRAVRLEFRVTGQGFDDAEPDALALSRLYAAPRAAYFVVEFAGQIIGGAGIAPYGAEGMDVCELQRMYLGPRARGEGRGRALLARCLGAARALGYRHCYLETAASLAAARHLYTRAGFRPLPAPLNHAVHSACDAYYLLDLLDPAKDAAA
jgi:putative acetyltransferase